MEILCNFFEALPVFKVKTLYHLICFCGHWIGRQKEIIQLYCLIDLLSLQVVWNW